MNKQRWSFPICLVIFRAANGTHFFTLATWDSYQINLKPLQMLNKKYEPTYICYAVRICSIKRYHFQRSTCSLRKQHLHKQHIQSSVGHLSMNSMKQMLSVWDFRRETTMAEAIRKTMGKRTGDLTRVLGKL